MDYLGLLQLRKSTRRFTGDQVSCEQLEHLIAAANNTPVGSNFYKDVHLTVVQDRAVLDKLSEAAAVRRKDTAELRTIAAETADSKAIAKNTDPFYGAPTVIFVSHRKQDLQPGIEWANVTLLTFSMHLAATEIGLGSVFMWYALESMRMLPEFDNTSILNVPDGFETLIGLAVGHPAKDIVPHQLKEGKIEVDYL